MSAPSPQTNGSTSVNPLAIPVAELASMLSKVSGRTVTAEQVRADLERGAPSLPDGRVNLVHYAAWLAREAQSK
jgi:hypothetical protein